MMRNRSRTMLKGTVMARSSIIACLLAAPLCHPVCTATAEEVVETTVVESTPVPSREAAAPEPDVAASEDVAVPQQLELRQAQEIALTRNPSLFAAAARVDQASARVRQARALYLPQVDAEAVATHTHLPEATVRDAREQALRAPIGSALRGGATQLFFDTGQGGGVESVLFSSLAGLYNGVQARNGVEDAVETYSVSVTASYVLFDGFSRRFTNAMASFGREETEAARLEAVRLILDAVAQSYHGVQLARENVAIARADESFNERLLKEARLRHERGTGSKSDVLNFEVALRAAQSARIRAEGQEQVARVALAGLMGLPEARLDPEVVLAPLPDETPDDLAAPDIDGKIALAMTARPDVQQGEHRLSRLEAQLGQRRSSYYPQVRTFASRSAQESDNGRIGEDEFSGTVGVNVTYNLFAGGRNRAGVAEARHQLEEAEYLLEELRIGTAADIRERAIELQTAQETLALQRTTAEFVTANRDLVEKEYEAGQGSLARLNQAQRDLVEAEARLALARVALYSAWHALQTATGETISAFQGYITPGSSGEE